MSVRELVAGIQREMLESDLQPSRAAELLSKATALIGNCNAEIREADAEYNEVLLTFLDADGTQARARIRAENSPQFRRKREARDTKELVIEMARSLKYILRAAEEEMRLTR